MSLRGYLFAGAAVLLLLGGGIIASKLMLHHVHAVEAQRDTARDAAQANGLQAQGAAGVADDIDKAFIAQDAARKAADALDTQARTDPAAQQPLSDSSVDRLRAGDKQLCNAGRVHCTGAPAGNSR